METTEPLLKLHRPYTCKERLGLAQQKNNVLRSENMKLKQRVAELEAMILPIPYSLINKEVISLQAYLRIKQRADMLYKQIFEVQQELTDLKRNNEKELL